MPSSIKLASFCCGAVFFASAVSFGPSITRADNLETVLPYVVENHDRVRAAKSRLTAARNRAREALGDWFPTLSQTANAGHEKQHNDNGPDSSTGFHEWDISLTQLLWDFGSTNAAIDKARLQVEEARYSLIETRQSLILEAITAYVDVGRAHAALQFALESEENIRRQTGLEEALVELGSGFSTDVLQAKTQLAGAQARQAQSEGALTTALNRYQAVFGRTPSNPEALASVPFPAAYIPTSLTQSIDIALEANPSLKNAILAADIAREDVRIAKADNFYPVIEGSAERKFKRNVSGTIGSEQETLAKVEMTFDINLGFTAVNTLKASEEDLSASEFSAADTRRNIEEQVRNAWQQLQTAQQTASHLANQANIANAFLELARNERQLGRRSLIDVLSGETNLINARSDALSAETDVIVAAYGLLAATGQLEYELLEKSKGAPTPKLDVGSIEKPSRELPSPPLLEINEITGSGSPHIAADTTTTSERSAVDFQRLMSVAQSDIDEIARVTSEDRWSEISSTEALQTVPLEYASIEVEMTENIIADGLSTSEPPVSEPETSKSQVENDPRIDQSQHEVETASLTFDATIVETENLRTTDTLTDTATTIFSFFQRAHEAKVRKEEQAAERERERFEKTRALMARQSEPNATENEMRNDISASSDKPISSDDATDASKALSNLFSALSDAFKTPRGDRIEHAPVNVLGNAPDANGMETESKPIASATTGAEDSAMHPLHVEEPSIDLSAVLEGFFSTLRKSAKSDDSSEQKLESDISRNSTNTAPPSTVVTGETAPQSDGFALTPKGEKLFSALGELFSPSTKKKDQGQPKSDVVADAETDD